MKTGVTVIPKSLITRNETSLSATYKTSYSNQYQDHGQVPKGIQRRPADFTPSKQPLEKVTSYKRDTGIVNTEAYKESTVANKIEKIKVKEYQRN